MTRNGYAVYKQTQVNTASGPHLVLMLYDAAIANLTQAKAAIEAHTPSEAHQRLIKAQDILTELMGALDTEREIGKNLYALYDYAYQRLVTANVKKEAEPVDEVLGYLTELRDTWRQAMAKARGAGGGPGGVSAEGSIRAGGEAGSAGARRVDVTS